MSKPAVNISRTPYEIINTLPVIYPDLGYAGLFQFGKTEHEEELSMWIITSYHLFEDIERKEDVKFEFSISTVYTINSKHSKVENYQLFYWMLTQEIENFNKEFLTLAIVNYPFEKLHIPSFEQVFIALDETFNPKFDKGAN